MTSLPDLLQFAFSGLTSGAIYALIALGFGVVHETMGIVNFAQVDFVTLGGMFAYTALRAAGVSMPVALPFAVVSVTLAGVALERVILRPSRSQNPMVLIFLTIGASIGLRGGIKLLWGKNPLALPPLAGEEPLALFGATVMPQALWILALTAVSVAALVAFFRRTRAGLAMRAVANNPRAAAAMGLRVGAVKAASFGLAGAMGGLAGVLVTPISALSFDVGVLLGLKGFSAAILGGFGSFPGAVVGGLLLGLLETAAAAFISSAYKDVVAFAVLLLVLFLRPQGLLGKEEA
ncbi:MAG: branched-chain amino acid ABC transporter permease [Deltaproteobacteria bacterium]|nr:branched-chain amino acid ABC transporter permease [Deltaproteobacteria bacterium]